MSHKIVGREKNENLVRLILLAASNSILIDNFLLGTFEQIIGSWFRILFISQLYLR